MRTKLFSALPAIAVFLAASHGGSAMAQTYTFSNLYPSSSSTIQRTPQSHAREPLQSVRVRPHRMR